MRLLGAMLVVLCAFVPAWAQAPLADEVRTLASRFHEDPAREGRS